MIDQLDFLKYKHEGEAENRSACYLNEGQGEEIVPFGVYLYKDHMKGKRDRAKKGEKITQAKLRTFGAGHQIQTAHS